jgi:hypothetical protein
MRVTSIEKGHKLREKLLLVAMGVFGGRRVPDVVKTLLYRREFWGDPYNELMHDVMRSPSDWTVGERELFAAFVSNLNRCRF